MSDEANPRELLQRYSGNPILGPHDFPKMVNAVFNPGATVIDGRTLLLLRVEHRTGLSSLVAATSGDGLTGWEIDPVRGLQPRADHFEEHWGIEDPRITRVGDEYFVVHVGYSTAGPLVCLAKTRDFVQWERCGVLQPPEDKDAALFPTTFGGRWALIHRPAPAMSGLGAHMWLSFSPDLRHWGDARVLLAARHGGWWDANKIGLGPPPLLTKDGWLLCYHGVRVTAAGSIYRLGLALLDTEDPTKVRACGNRVDIRSSRTLRAVGRRARRRIPVRLDPARRRRHPARLRRRRGQRRLRSRGESGETVEPSRSAPVPVGRRAPVPAGSGRHSFGRVPRRGVTHAYPGTRAGWTGGRPEVRGRPRGRFQRVEAVHVARVFEEGEVRHFRTRRRSPWPARGQLGGSRKETAVPRPAPVAAPGRGSNALGRWRQHGNLVLVDPLGRVASLGQDGRSRPPVIARLQVRRPTEATSRSHVPTPSQLTPQFGGGRLRTPCFGILSTYPPTACGMATFSTALADGLVANGAQVNIVRVADGSPASSRRVIGELVNGCPRSVAASSELLNRCDVAIVQHEYGLYGGADGDEVLDVLAGLQIPSIVIAHTILQRP